MTSMKRFEENISLVGYVYQKHFSAYTDYHEDIIQEGYLGLWKACLNFDETRGIQFSTYAYKAIKRKMSCYIQRFIQKHSSVISLETVIAEDGEGNQLYLEDMIGVEEDISTRCLIQDTLMHMNNQDQQVIHSLMQGYTQDQVAKIHKISQPSVHRCLMRFKKLLLEKGEE